MIGDLFNNNKRKDVVTRTDQVMRFGKKWRQDKKTGYYLCTTLDESGNRRRLHVEVWEQAHGVCVPPGCVIHHLDWNKSNNNVENLICVSIEEHERIHNIIGRLDADKGKAYGYELIESRDDRGLPKEYKSDII